MRTRRRARALQEAAELVQTSILEMATATTSSMPETQEHEDEMYSELSSQDNGDEVTAGEVVSEKDEVDAIQTLCGGGTNLVRLNSGRWIVPSASSSDAVDLPMVMELIETKTTEVLRKIEWMEHVNAANTGEVKAVTATLDAAMTTTRQIVTEEMNSTHREVSSVRTTVQDVQRKLRAIGERMSRRDAAMQAQLKCETQRFCNNFKHEIDGTLHQMQASWKEHTEKMRQAWLDQAELRNEICRLRAENELLRKIKLSDNSENDPNAAGATNKRKPLLTVDDRLVKAARLAGEVGE